MNALRFFFRQVFRALLFTLLSRGGQAQILRLYVGPETEPALEKLDAKVRQTLHRSAPDTLVWMGPECEAQARGLLDALHRAAYLTASIDSLHRAPDSSHTARLYLGPLLRWVALRPAGPADARWLAAAGFRERQFLEKPLRHETVLRLQQRVLEQAENNGYPFAAVRLDSIRFDSGDAVSALVRVDAGPFFSYMAPRVNGNVRLPARFLPQYLGMRPGAPYSHARVLAVRERLNALLFVETLANPTVTFAGSEARVNLFLQKKRASRFDFIIGLLPRPNNTDGQLLLTGSLSAALLNALNQGERLSVELERLRPETQKLELQAGLPYLLGLPFGVEGRLHIFRRDSSWLDAQSEIGLRYQLEGGNYLQFFWENKNSSLQQVDTQVILLSRRLPEVLDLRQNGFGLEALLSRLDYRFNPRRGWLLQLRAVAGFNTVLRNSQIEALRDPIMPEFNFATLYDSVGGRAARFRLEGRAEHYLPVLARSTLLLRLRGGAIFSEKPVYANEQYRIGGNKVQRGFDEESLFATRYLVTTLEYRLLLSQNAYLSAFTDYGYLENRTDRNRFFLRPWGLGAGLNFETQAGIFGLSLAVGRRDVGQAVEWRAPKFHLGYVNLF